MSLFKRKKAGEEANTIPEAMDDITQTLLIPVKDEGAKTMCADAYETSQAEIASYPHNVWWQQLGLYQSR